MRKAIQSLTLPFAVLALLSAAALILGDLRHGFRPSSFHGKAGAFALMFVGASYIAAQAKRRISHGDLLRAVMLGSAFVLWGAEQFVGKGRFLTVMDSAVIGIFVVDLYLIILAMRLAEPGA